MTWFDVFTRNKDAKAPGRHARSDVAVPMTQPAGGNVPISWPFLFFYGLERRILVDAVQPGPARDEVPAIRAEVIRLLDLYGGNNSFRRYATGFLGLIDFYGTGSEVATTLGFGVGEVAAALHQARNHEPITSSEGSLRGLGVCFTGEL